MSDLPTTRDYQGWIKFIQRKMDEQLYLDFSLPLDMEEGAKAMLVSCIRRLKSFYRAEENHSIDPTAFDINNDRKELSYLFADAFMTGSQLEKYQALYYKKLSQIVNKFGERKLPKLNYKWLHIGSVTLDYLHCQKWPSNSGIRKRMRFYNSDATKAEVNKAAEKYCFIQMLVDDRNLSQNGDLIFPHESQ